MTGVLAALATGRHLHSSNHRLPLSSSRRVIGAKRSSPTSGMLPSPPRLARSPPPLAAQADEEEQGSRPRENPRDPGRAPRAERAAAAAEKSPAAAWWAGLHWVRSQLHAEIWLKSTPNPSRPPPLKPLEAPGSRDLKTREAGSPAHDDVTDAAAGGR